MTSPLRIACVGCGHGALNEIYERLDAERAKKNWDAIDCVIIGGDFQSLRNSNDATCISVPSKYKTIGDFHEYYSGQRVAPVLTIFCGGNHEAGNYLFELYYGGWVAPNIYYLGAANVLRLGPLRISGMSGIWKGYDYRKQHHERLPYNDEDIQSIYHIREMDVRKLLQVRTQVDMGLSHDWPRGIENYGNSARLFQKKKHLRDDSVHGRLGSQAARDVLDRLCPSYWFSAHLHTRFALTMGHCGVSLRKAPPSVDEPEEWAYEAVPPTKPTTPTKESPMGLDGELSTEHMVLSQMPGVTGDELSYLAGGHTFAETTPKEEIAEVERKPAESNDPSCTRLSPTEFEKTCKQINIAGDTREVVATHRNTTGNDQVQNDDEIDLDSSSASGSDSPPAKRPMGAVMDGANDSKPILEDKIPDSIRSKLPASLTRPKPAPQPTKKVIPDAIKNRVTKFMALDKPGGRDPYLELVEVKPISSQPNGQLQRPLRLQYDKEWLAITRAFAQDLQLGDPTATVPADVGEAGYRQAIMEAETWVEENVVQRGLLNVPFNFTRVAPVFDPSIPITTTDAPPEYPSPQTEEFCKLIGITNKFALSDEERAARMAAGARPSSRPNFDSSHRRGARGRQGRGRRGGWGRGRGSW